MYTYMSGDVEISGPAYTPAENLTMQVVDSLDHANVAEVEVVHEGRTGITIEVVHGTMPEVYQHLSDAGYDVHCTPVRDRLSISIRTYITL